jgi:hypothetical protein
MIFCCVLRIGLAEQVRDSQAESASDDGGERG